MKALSSGHDDTPARAVTESDAVLGAGAYFGDYIDQRRVAGLVLTEKQHASGEVLETHSHAHAYFCTVLAGGWEETVKGLGKSSATAAVRFNPSGITHSASFSGKVTRVFNVELDSRWEARLSEVGTVASAPVTLDPVGGAHLSWRLYREFREFDLFSDAAVESLVWEMLSGLASSKTTATRNAPPWLQMVREVIRDDCKKVRPLDELASLAGVHPVYLARRFRAVFGQTVGDMYRRCRINSACDSLSRPDKPLSEIAIDCGFYDQSHFTRAFKRETGATPARFRTWVTTR